MKLQVISTAFLLVTALSCKQANIDPAHSIEGTYNAKTYNFASPSSVPYPINGQEVTLQIKYVSADTVQVKIEPTPVGITLPAEIYSPTQTLTYPKAYVKSIDYGSRKDYYVYLIPATDPNIYDKVILLYSGNSLADYIFTPIPTPSFSTIIRFEKR
jgi:hypothetical protein